jgi:hypothetical protein
MTVLAEFVRKRKRSWRIIPRDIESELLDIEIGPPAEPEFH